MKLHVTTESGKRATVEFHDWDTHLDQDREAIREQLDETMVFVYVEAGKCSKVLFEDEVEDSGDSGIMSYVLTSGQAATDPTGWGAWIQILSANDTPTPKALASSTHYRVGKLNIIDAPKQKITRIQLAFGVSAPVAMKASVYTEFMFKPSGGTLPESLQVQMPPQPIGAPVWARIWIDGDDGTGTVSVALKIYEFAGGAGERDGRILRQMPRRT